MATLVCESASTGRQKPDRRSTGASSAFADRVLVASSDGVRTVDGSELACFRGRVDAPDHVVGAGIDWVVAIQDNTVHVADLSTGDCVRVALSGDIGELGRPVVAGRRVYVPERRTGIVHVVQPSVRLATDYSVLPAGDMRLIARGDFVVAYDSRTPLAALLGPDAVDRFVDTSIDERGIAAVIADTGSAAVVGNNPGDELAGDGSGADGPGAEGDAPLLDTRVLASVVESPDDDEVEPPPTEDLVANFAVSATTVAVGEPIRVVDESTGAPDTWRWDFGDGTGAEGPEADKAWDEAGTYVVTLRISRGEETAAISLAITVVPTESSRPPAADFVFSATVADVGESITFEDRSDGDINRWRWDFGDGTAATDQNVTKAWDSPGRYAVRLTVANEQGSDSAVVFIEVVAGLRAPVAVIEATATEVDLGAPVAFRASSSTDPARFSWDFGDGRTSSGPAAIHVFLAEGTFTVTLTADNAAGVSTATLDVVVAPPTQTPTAALGTLPSVIEVGEVVTLSSLSTNSPDVETWSFGDGTTATGAEVTHAWQSPGTYLLSLTATNSAGSDTFQTLVQVLAELPPPIAQIGDYDESPWVGTATVFLDASVDATTWLWDFGDGATSNAPNPLHTFSSAGPKTVTLTVTNRNGTDSASVVVEARLQPSASFVVSSTAVRAGESVTFTDESVNAATWSWTFGDGTSASVQNPVHTFAAAGTYDVVLRITSATGDEDTFGPLTITVDPAPPRLSGILKVPVNTGPITTATVASFAAVDAPNSGPIDLYVADFGDGSSPAQSATGAFTHTYAASGTYVVSMRAQGPLGDSSEPVTRSFTVADPPAPLVDIGPSVPASAPIGNVTLTGVELPGSGPIAGWRWQVSRNGNVWDYTGRVVSHNFTAAGVYSLRLTAESPSPRFPTASRRRTSPSRSRRLR